MSEGITHTAVVDDNVRLLLKAPFICDAFKAALITNQELARLGSIARWGDRHNPDLLTELREAYKAGSAGTTERNRLAWVLGWLSHRAADRTAKHIFRALDSGCPFKPTDCSIYHDAVVFKEVYGGGSGPFPLETVSQGALSPSEVAVQALFQRLILCMHTFTPDSTAIGEWIDKVEKFRQNAYVNLERYRKAVMEPDPDMVQRFIVGPNFYEAQDPIIAAARAIANGEELEVDWGSLVDDKLATSTYAQALRRAFRYVSAANQYFQFEIEREELEERMDIGKPEQSVEGLA